MTTFEYLITTLFFASYSSQLTAPTPINCTLVLYSSSCPKGCIFGQSNQSFCYVQIHNSSYCSQIQNLSSVQVPTQDACQANFPSKQCEWRVSNNTLNASVMSCQSYYQPSVCEGNNGQPLQDIVCGRTGLQCKYQNNTPQGCLTINSSTDGCQSSSYWINQASCVNMNQLCAWTPNISLPSLGNCTNQVDSSNCSDGRNILACRSSSFPCAWDNKCVPYNSFMHYCDDDLSQSACKQVPFGCMWANNNCSWFNSSLTDCSLAANQVACLLSTGGCQWQLNGTCIKDNFLQENDPLWQFTQDVNFNAQKVKQYIEDHQSKTSNSPISSSTSVQNVSNGSSSVPTMKKTFSQMMSIYLTLLLSLNI